MPVSTQLKVPTYKRQRLLLFFLEAAGKSLSKMDLQKLLFLYHQETSSEHYAFVPYRFGSYSFLAADDLDLMEKRGWITTRGKEISLSVSIKEESWARGDKERQSVRRWLYRQNHRGEDLVAETYRRFPYYAIHSEMRNRLLSENELRAVDEALPEADASGKPILFTLGYEGIHFEDYLNKLIRHRVAMLCDVRSNPHSRKFGFSSKMLASTLPHIGIAYQHLPELGIASEKRKSLHSMADYEDLFADYRQDLPTRREGLKRLQTLIRENKQVALTCFEAEPHCCHRHCISDHLAENTGIEVVHL